LKFRQPGQGVASDVARRDLRLELLKAEAKTTNGKDVSEGETKEGGGEDEQVAKRRRLLEEAKNLDRDDSDDEASTAKKSATPAAAKETAGAGGGGDTDEEEEESEEEESDDDEDDTQALLRELEKIKRERAVEKERQVRICDLDSITECIFGGRGVLTRFIGDYTGG
jgi:protein CWC15